MFEVDCLSCLLIIYGAASYMFCPDFLSFRGASIQFVVFIIIVVENGHVRCDMAFKKCFVDA